MSAFSTSVPALVLVQLLEPTKKFIQNLQTNLIEENARKGNPSQGFLFQGVFVTDLSPVSVVSKDKKFLHKDLHEEAKVLFEYKKRYEADRIKLYSFLGLLLAPCYTNQDFRDALPEIIIKNLNLPFNKLTRTRPFGWTMNNNPMHQYQLQEIEEFLSLHTANKFLF